MDKTDNKSSIAYDICKMLKEDNKRLFIANLVLSASLIASIVINRHKKEGFNG